MLPSRQMVRGGDAAKINPGLPIGLPLDEFQAVDKTRRWPIAPDERQPGAHGRFILEQSLREGL
jgi:hypothetical protein